MNGKQQWLEITFSHAERRYSINHSEIEADEETSCSDERPSSLWLRTALLDRMSLTVYYNFCPLLTTAADKAYEAIGNTPKNMFFCPFLATISAEIDLFSSLLSTFRLRSSMSVTSLLMSARRLAKTSISAKQVRK